MEETKINLVYMDGLNFGDQLSPFLINELSGKEIQTKQVFIARWYLFLKGIISFDLVKIKETLFFWQKNIIAVGSVISDGNTKSFIWGSGFMNKTDGFKGGTTFAVRGKLTAEKLCQMGHPDCATFGDPALLLPIVIPASGLKRYKLGIIPHYTETLHFNELYGEQYKIIDLNTKDIGKVIEEINNCEYVLSTSLHGVIVAHAYDIPALWIKKGDIHTDGFKFHDYFSSVDIKGYDGFENIADILKDEASWLQLFENNKEKSLINNSLAALQKRLLSKTPFILKDKYKKLI